MNAIDWLIYFRQNQRDRRGVAWHEPVQLPESLRAPVSRALERWSQVERRDAARLRRWCGGEAAEWLVAEKEENAELLARVAVRFGGAAERTPPVGGFLTGPWSVAAVVVRDAVLLRLYGTLRATVPDPVLGVVCDQVLHDKKFHVRFLCALRGTVPRGVVSGFGWWAIFSAVWRQRTILQALGVPVGNFVRGCWQNFRAAEAALFTGQEFTRGATEQLPGLARVTGACSPATRSGSRW